MRFIYQGITKCGNGRIIQSATVSVFLTGTTTPADVYEAESGGSSVNSVTSDSDDGHFSFWVDDSDYSNTDRFAIRIVKANFLTKTYSDLLIIPATGVDTANSPVDNDYAKFTDANTIEGRSFTEVKADLSLDNVSNVATDDTAYNATSWDSNTDAATKNAIRDKIETMAGGHDAVTLNANATAGGLSLSTQEINFRAATNAQTGYVTDTQITAVETNTTHRGLTDNPHSVDRADVGVVDIYVTDYGGGTGFDNAAIVAAFAAADDGDHIIFPVGDYTLTSAVSTDKRVLISGNNVEITCTGVGGITLSGVKAVIRDFVFTGDRSGSTTCLTIANDFITATNLKIYLFANGIAVTAGVWQNIQNIRLRNIKTIVLTVANIVGTVVTDFRYNTDTGSYAQPTYGIKLTGQGCNFSDLDFIHAGTALQIEGDSSTAAGAVWNFFNSCSFDTSTYACNILSADASSVVRGVMFDHCWFASSTEKGIVMSGSYTLDGVTFNGCHIVSNAKDGMSIEDVSTNIDVNGCVFTGNTKDAASTYSHIYTNSLGRKLIRNNFFGTWGKPSTTYTAKAAVERGAADLECYIDGNVSKGDVSFSGGLDDSASHAVDLGTNFGNLPSASGAGTVTSVAAGNGLDFTTITGSGSATMGTPGTTTASSTNAVTTTSHTHQLDESGITIAASNVSDFDTEVSNNSTVSSNTSARHTQGTDTSLGTQTQGLQMGDNNIAGIAATITFNDDSNIIVPTGKFLAVQVGSAVPFAFTSTAFQPGSSRPSLGTNATDKEFLNLYVENIWLDGTPLDVQDDLYELNQIGLRTKADGSPDINKRSGFQYMDLYNMPDHMTNIVDLRKDIKKENKKLTYKKIEELIKPGGKFNHRLKRHLGTAVDLASGSVKQLDENMQMLFEHTWKRIKELENEVKELKAKI